MRIRIKRINLLNINSEDRRHIDHVLDHSPNATVFHTIEWNQLLIDYFGLKNVTLLAHIADNPVGLFNFYRLKDNSCWSSAVNLHSVYGGPISTNNSVPVIIALLKKAENICPFADFRIWTPPHYDISAFLHSGYTKKEMYTPIMNIQGTEEELWARMPHDKRYEIRKALKNNIRIKIGDTKALYLFCHLLEETLAKSGLTSLPEGFLIRLFEKLHPLGRAKLWIAEHDETIISSAFILYYKNTAYYWNIGWRREYGKLGPNDLMSWEIVKDASQKGCVYYDLLRLEPDRLPSIALWKKKFGGDVATCYYLSKSPFKNKIWRGTKMILADPPRAFQKIFKSRFSG